MNTHEILVAARKLIEKPEAWCKGDDAGNIPDGKLCAMLAIAEVCEVPEVIHGAFQPARMALAEVVGERVVSSWNDAPERTHAEVLAAFDRAIEATNPTPAQPTP